jgi:uncharacterized phiE125 gp8 family phage protein
MPLKRTSDAATEPVTLTEMKLHLRVDHETEDDLITSLIKSARQLLEEQTGRAFITQTWQQTLEEWPDGYVIRVPRSPLIAVTDIKYYDTDGELQTLSADLYDVNTNAEPARITKAYGESWPSLYGVEEAITVTYTAGYGDAEDVPDGIKTAIKFLAAHWYRVREAVQDIQNYPVPFAVESLVGQFKVYGGVDL